MSPNQPQGSTKLRGAVTIAACLAVAALAFAGCGDDDGTSGSAQTATQQEKATTQAEAVPAVVSVSIGDNFYKPKDVTIQVGQSVKWKNNGAVAHTVTSDSDSTVKFDSGTLQPRGVYALKPGSRGKLTYFCSIHGKVQSGTITVNR
jgi:plastocyanin